MEDKRCKQIAETAFKQLFCSITRDVYYSWGVSNKEYGMYENMPTLMLKVSGAIFKGWVYISLNDDKDMYEIRLVGNNRVETIKKVTDIMFDIVGEIIDSLVERPSGMSDDEYYRIAMADSYFKIGEK